MSNATTPVRRKRRLSWQTILLMVLVAAVLLGLTTLSILRGVSRSEATATVVEVRTGQSMEIEGLTENSVIRLQMMRAPVLPVTEEELDAELGGSEGEGGAGAEAVEPAETETTQASSDGLPPVPNPAETLETCLAEASRDHLESLTPVGSGLELTHPDYPAAPNGEVWAMIDDSAAGSDVVLEQIRAGLAAPMLEEAPNDQVAQQLREAQQEAFDNQRGIYSTDADCTFRAQVEPELEYLGALPEANYTDIASVTEFIGQLNSLNSRATQLRTNLANIPVTGETFAALAWGTYKESYVTELEGTLTRINELLDAAQDARISYGEEARAAEESRRAEEAAREERNRQWRVRQQQEQEAAEAEAEAEAEEEPAEEEAAEPAEEGE